MSNTALIIPERSANIGDFLVGRLLPFQEKKMVGPFIFIDHMTPTKLFPGHYLDIGQHPHIGLCTLTFLLKGAVQHEDSTGSKQRIEPGSVNWMIAGKGVTHTERTPKDLHGQELDFHGFQIWVALPTAFEETAPEFHHVEASSLPRWQQEGAAFILVAGKGYGHQSPVPVHSPLFMLDIRTGDEAFLLDTTGQITGETGFCIVEGAVEACGTLVESGQMLVSNTADACKILLKPNTHVLLFGGEPLPEDRHIFWNFVSSDREKIERAKKEWEARTFPMVANDNSYIPLPPKIRLGDKK